MSTDEGGRAPADGSGDPDGTGAPGDRGNRRGLRRVLIALGALALVLVLVAGGSFWWLSERYAGNIERIGDVFAEIPEAQRPAPVTPADAAVDEEPVTFLLVGADTRAQTPAGQAPDGRSDAIIIARLAADREHAQLVSIPRDSWVDIPGYGKNKINASYAFGGPSLLIQTVEQLTGVRIDHFVAIDFDGLIQVTDDLGGVDVVVAETTTNEGYTFEAGVNHLDGEAARWYLAQRYGLPGGDFDRVKRQQQFVEAVFRKLISSDTLTDPGKLDASLRAVTSAVAVDDDLGTADMLSLANSLRGVGTDGLQSFTAPVLGTGMEGAASVVYLDDATAERMWQYLRTDSLAQNAEEFTDQALGETPR